MICSMHIRCNIIYAICRYKEKKHSLQSTQSFLAPARYTSGGWCLLAVVGDYVRAEQETPTTAENQKHESLNVLIYIRMTINMQYKIEPKK